MWTLREPVGQEVHTPPCLVQNEQVQARAGISAGSGRQSREKEMLPQWQDPEMSMAMPTTPDEPAEKSPGSAEGASLPGPQTQSGVSIGQFGAI